MPQKSRDRAARSPSVSRAARYGRVGELLPPVLLIVACAVTAHARAAGGTFLWDDDINLTENLHLRDLAGLSRMWFDVGATNMYAPLTFTTLWVQYQFFALDPTGYHVVNIGFHALNAVLIWFLLRRLAPSAALLASLLFAVHPITVESVAWITELRNLQSFAFYALCLLAYLRFAALDGRPPWTGRLRAAGYALVMVLFAAALSSKPAGVALPLVVLLIAWWKRGTIVREDLAVAAPMLAMSLAAGLLTMYVDTHFAGGGAALPMSMVERVLGASRAVWFYAGKLAWPHPLLSIYPRWDVQATAWWQYVFPVGLLAVLGLLWALRTRLGRGPLVAACTFILLLAPTSGLFPLSSHLYSFVADRFQYHASVAFIALAAAVLVGVVKSFVPGSWPRRLAGSALVAAAATATAIHTGAYRSEKDRCLHTVERNPAAWVAMNNLGVALNAEGRHEEAAGWYRKAMQLRRPYPEAHSNLAAALVALGRPAEAIAHCEEALRVWPDYAQAHNNMATALAAQGDRHGALAHYEAALRAKPDFAKAHNNLGQLLTRMGDVERAIEHHRAALRLRPDYAEAHHDLAVTLSAAKRYEEAEAAYRIALGLRPGSASETAAMHAGRGLAFASAGRMDEAARAFQEALRLHPGQADAHNGLGNVLAARGELSGAITHYRGAIDAKPDFVEARANLGKALATEGHLSEATAQLREALRRDDSLADAHNTLGICLASSGQLDEAIVHFRRAVALDGTSASARENLDRALALRRQPPMRY